MDNSSDKPRNSASSQSAQLLSYDDKLRLANRDALHAVIALGVVVVVWLFCGFGLSALDVKVFHVPLWVAGGLLGTWAAAIVASIILARSFKNFELAEEKSPAEPQCDEQRGHDD